MTSRPAIRRTTVALFIGTTAALSIGAASPGLAPAAPENASAAATITALSSGDTAGALTAFPDDFSVVMGYRPIVEQHSAGDVLVDPDGSCSSPVPLPAAFEPSCRIHDLGYDLLRYARDSGGELDAGARRALDAQLRENLADACGIGTDSPDRVCDVVAGIASATVQVNSWRQGYRLPVSESPRPYMTAAAAALVALAVGFARKRR